jgi:enoyl-CoA hydratase
MTDASFENLLYEVHDACAWITVHRPDKLNALDRKTVAEIGLAASRASADSGVRVVVVTGAGDKAFVAGADIREMSAMGAGEAQSFSRSFQEALDRLERSSKPVIAAVNGFALGGGCELAMACHLRIAAENARFGQPEVKLGLIPGAGGTQRLSRIVGRGRALELILGGEIVDAAEAHRIGLVNRVVPARDLRSEASAWADRLRSRSPMALARALEAVLSGGEVALPEALRQEAALFGLCFATEDMREGTRAFLEKREPAFPGR